MLQKTETAFITLLQPEHLPQVQRLINMHLSTLVPGWGLPQSYIASQLQRDPGQYVIDPWVQERATLCALVKQRVVAAAHLLRYSTGPEVGKDYQNVGDMAWFLAWPDASQAAAMLLAAVHRQCVAWEVSREYAWDAGLPIGPFVGVPDVWPHISTALEEAGYHLNPGRVELVYGGALDQILAAATPPITGMTIQRTMGSVTGARFVALLHGEEVGQCECDSDLTQGGELPALQGWGEISEMQVKESWRNRDTGTWLLQQAVAWHRLGGGTRMLLSVTAEDEAAGAGRFYQRLGWQPLVRQRVGWEWSEMTEAAASA
ncbi:MAG TPA: GNAT family N-acetyltransferase [Ktedonosporobacter sp.]|nr:GNAT family N-acetyltransferase [Ktedonosporobacter sp.]